MEAIAVSTCFRTIRENNRTGRVGSQHISFEICCHSKSQFREVAQVDERAALKMKPINECIDGTDVQVIVG